MRTGIHLQGCMRVTVVEYLLQINGQEGGDGARRFVLMYMPEFVGNQSRGLVILVDEDAMPDGQSDGPWTMESSLHGHFNRASGHRLRETLEEGIGKQWHWLPPRRRRNPWYSGSAGRVIIHTQRM